MLSLPSSVLLYASSAFCALHLQGSLSHRLDTPQRHTSCLTRHHVPSVQQEAQHRQSSNDLYKLLLDDCSPQTTCVYKHPLHGVTQPWQTLTVPSSSQWPLCLPFLQRLQCENKGPSEEAAGHWFVSRKTVNKLGEQHNYFYQLDTFQASILAYQVSALKRSQTLSSH